MVTSTLNSECTSLYKIDVKDTLYKGQLFELYLFYLFIPNLQVLFLHWKHACDTCSAWSPATASTAVIACPSVSTADADVHKRALSVWLSLSRYLSQTCSFCLSASLSSQRKPWPRFQTRLVAIAKIFSEFYGLWFMPKSYLLCACVLSFHSSTLSWVGSPLSAARPKPQMLL